MATMLEDQGALHFSDSVTKYYNAQRQPAFAPLNAFDPDVGAAAVTLESLASHTSGLPRESVCLLSKECTEQLVMQGLEITPLSHRPLTHPHYSNLGNTLLGRCCERAAQDSTGNAITYEEWVTKYILQPLNMASSGFDYPDSIKQRMAVGCLWLGTPPPATTATATAN